MTSSSSLSLRSNVHVHAMAVLVAIAVTGATAAGGTGQDLLGETKAADYRPDLKAMEVEQACKTDDDCNAQAPLCIPHLNTTNGCARNLCTPGDIDDAQLNKCSNVICRPGYDCINCIPNMHMCNGHRTICVMIPIQNCLSLHCRADEKCVLRSAHPADDPQSICDQSLAIDSFACVPNSTENDEESESDQNSKKRKARTAHEYDSDLFSHMADETNENHRLRDDGELEANVEQAADEDDISYETESIATFESRHQYQFNEGSRSSSSKREIVLITEGDHTDESDVNMNKNDEYENDRSSHK